MENCVFCDKNNSPRDTIYQTDNFFVKIGLGLAAPGHVMLIPKEHYICFADMSVKSRDEFEGLKNFVFDEVKKTFSEPFLVEYGPVAQTVAHAHLHFVPKKRQETPDYSGYEIKNIFQEMAIPQELITQPFSWPAMADLRQKYGKYVFLQDGDQACLYSEAGSGLLLKKLCYRTFIAQNFQLVDIPARWQEITAEQLRIDALKKQTTRDLLRF